MRSTEPAESFQLHLVAPSHATPIDAIGTATIVARRDRRRVTPYGPGGGLDRRRRGHAALERAGGRTDADRVRAHWRRRPRAGAGQPRLRRVAPARIGRAARGRLLRPPLQPGRDVAQPGVERIARAGWDRVAALDANRVDWSWPWDPRSHSTGARPSAPGRRRAPCSKSAVRPTWRCRSGPCRPSRSPAPLRAPTRSPCARPMLMDRAARRTRYR